MEKLDLETVKKLISVENTPCISLYMPIYSSAPRNTQNGIAFKNLLRECIRKIDSENLTEHSQILNDNKKLLEDNTIWERSARGIAIFLSKEDTLIYELPIEIETISILSDNFFIRPLFQIFQDNLEYYILTLSQDRVTLFRGNNYDIEEIEIQDKIPTSMEEALGPELTQNHINSASTGNGNIHGYMEVSKEMDNDMIKFFQIVDQALTQFLPLSEKIPIFVATLPEHHSHFLRVAKNRNISSVKIPLSPNGLQKKDLLKLIMSHNDTLIREKETRLIKRYYDASSNKLGKELLGEILRDSIDGRIEILTIEPERYIPGEIDVDSRKIHSNGHSTGEILNDLARMVFKQGGEVHIMDKCSMPTSTGAFTINRF